MKWLFALAFVAPLPLLGRTTDDDPIVAEGRLPPAPPPVPAPPVPAPKQLVVSVRMLEGDPSGSPEAGLPTELSSPTIVLMENSPAYIGTGASYPVVRDDRSVDFAPIGMVVRMTPGVAKDGKISLDLTLEKTALEEDRDGTRIVAASTRTVGAKLTLGEAKKFPWGGADPRHWAEVTITVSQ
jgi:hypothetical protein